jgi:T1SS-143 domain-containing protein
MSVEDPRLSNISEENLTENFSSEIQEEIAASSTPSPIEHEIQVAQAGDGRTPTTGRVPTDPNVPAAAPAAPAAEVTPDVNNIVHLATSVSIDDIRVDGANLILVQADGTEIVIVNGAVKIPTMLIGEVEVPQQVLFAALEDSGINVAAGPDGSFSASGRPDSSGAEFDDSIQASQNDPIQLASLLGDTEFGDGGGLDDRTAADDQPDAFDMGSPFIFSESVLADDVIGNETITGTLGFDGGDDFGIVSSVNYQSTFDMAEGTGSGVAAPLTSGGQAVTVSTSADGLTVTGTITVGETTVTVFTLTVTNPTTGAFTYTQSQPLDHPDLGQIGADDALRLNFTFTVTDKDGDSDTGSFSIEIGDDGPVQSEAGNASLNEDDVSTYPATDGSDAAKKTGDISLGISWGADADTRNGEGDTFGRSVGFANAAGAVPANAGGVYTDATDVGLSVTGGALTSGGSELYYVITDLGNGGQTLTAYVDGSEPAAKVFEISLDPTSANGSYTVEIFQELDHGSDSDALAISFQFQGVDADGDAAASGTALITIADDAPVIGAAGEGSEGKVDEGGSNTAQGSLGISWGADDGNTSEDGGYDGTQDAGDRSVVFTPGEVSDLPPADGDDMPALKVGSPALSTAAVSAFMQVWSGETEIALGNLTSGGQPLVYTLSPDGTVLTAADQEGGPVFTVTLSDTGAGGYTFDLQGVLDHPGHGETGSETDILTFEFTYTVRDGDGDVAESTFTVDVKDDVPVATGNAVEATADEDDISNWLSSGTHPNDGAADGSTTGPTFGSATVSGSIASVVAFGADGAAAGGGFGFVADAAAKMQALALTSKGGTLSYAMIGDTLVAYVNVAGGIDRPVFSLTLDDATGAFTYRQYDQLDHVAGNGENTALKSGSGSIAAIDFGAVIQATDGDGDHVGLGGKFSITITDDVPVPSITTTGRSTTIDETVNNQNQSNDTGNQAVRSLFAAVANVGHDADMGNAAIFARNGDALVSTSSSKPGADETTTTVLSLEIASAGLDSGLATTGGKSIFLFQEGGLIVGRFDSDGNGTPDTAAFAVAIDQSGRVSVAQYVSLHQGDTATSNETVNLGGKISAVVTATDYDGDVVRDTVSIGSHIRFADDGPLASGAKVSFTADEDDISNWLSSGTHPNDGAADGSTSSPSLLGLGDAATVSGSIASVVAFGADGAAAGGGFSFAADAAAKMQALALTSKGGTLSYAMVGDALVAYVNVAGGAGFNLFTDRPVFSLTLDHATGAFTYQQYDQLDHVTGNGENTALKSGSGSIAAIDFGAVIQATDGDGDQIGLGGKFSITITDDIPVPSITTTGLSTTIDETSGFQNDDSGAGSIGSLFAGVGNRGVDADLGGPIHARDDVIDISVNDGADDNVSTALTLRIDGENGINSGLVTTGGAPIYPYLEGEVVVGRVGGANGLAAFAIAIDGDGRVSVAEYLSLKHPNNASSDEGVNLSGKISAVLTATDYDGDVVTKSVSIGDKIAFEDDGPSVGGNSAVWVDDDNVAGAQGNNSGTGDHALANTTGELSHDFGADGGSIAWKTTGAPTGFTYVRDGDALLVKQGATTVMTITLDTATGAYSVTQNAAIDHPAGNNENDVAFNLTYTVTDGDGDHVDGTLTINADDDTPISTGAIGIGITESAAGSSIAGELSALVSPGADGIGRYSVETTGLSSSLTSLTSGGVALTYSVVGNALVAKAGAVTIFTFTVDPATGHYAFAQSGPLDHTQTVVIDGASIPAAALGAVGSHAAVPDVGGNHLAFLGRMPDEDVIIRVTNGGNSAVTWILNNKSGGTDYSLEIPAHTTWYVNVGNVANSTKFELDGDGSSQSTTVNNGHHQPIVVIGNNSALALDLSSAVTVTDGDEDRVALNGQLIVTVTDGVPTAGPNASGTVEEGGTETITAALTGLAWGADAGSARTLSFTGSVATTDQNGAPVAGLSSSGRPVTIDVINGVLTGFVGSANPLAPGDIVFTASLNVATGAYSFSLIQPLDHTAPNATSQYLDLALSFTATDADGDAATSTVTVRVDAAGTIGSINYSNLSTSVFVNLDDAAHMIGGQTVAADTATDGATVIDKVIGIDSVSGIVDALGGAGNDVLIGGDEANNLNGNGGDDSLFGGAGNDRFGGGTGINKMVGGTGNDQFFATGGTDTIHGNGEADIAATAGENDMVVYYGNQSNFAITRMLDGGWQVLNTANGEIDKLYGVESINFNGGAIELDLTAPVQLFNGNNLVGTFTTISDANTAASAGFRIELVGTVTNQSATITQENLTVVGGAEDTGIVLTLNGVQNITLQGEAPIKVIGDGLSNTINGNDGANILEGGDGNDVLNGNGGDDSLFGGAGNDRFGGGTGINKMVGGTGNDQFFATGGTDTIHGNGEADIAATAGENDMVVYYGNQSNFAITRMLDGGWQVLNTANGEIDKLYGVESINFNGGAIELDLTAPVQLFNGNNLVGTFTTISDANTAASAGFRIELVGTVTNQSATITQENLTVVGGAEDTGIVLTLNGVQNITLQGEAPIKVIGDGLSNTINGNDGANILEGGDGNDVLNGNGGDDTIQWSVGDGLDVVDGGTEPAGSDLDLLRVVGSSASEQYAIWSVAAYNAAHAGVPYGGSAEILLTVNGALAAEVKEIEDIVIQGGGGTDTLAVNGSFAGTSLLTSTITYEGGEGDETFDVSELASGHSVVVKGAGGTDVLVIGNDDGESVWKDVTVTQDPVSGEFTISLPNGGPVLKATGVESFQFADGTVTAAELIEQAPTALTTSGLAVAENSAAGTVVGSVQGVDANGSIDPLSYAFVLADSSTSLTSADGRFVINASTGEISVAAGAVLDYETTPSIGLSVLVTDSKNGSYSETFSVQLTNVNEAPTDITAPALSVAENSVDGTVVGSVTGVDPDSSGLNYSFVVGGALSATSADGRFSINATTGEITVADGTLLDYETGSSHDVTIRVTDAGNLYREENFSIAVTDIPENVDPVVTGSTNGSVTEDAAFAVSSGELVNNGGFETGNFSGWSWTATSFTGVTQISSEVHSGSWALETGPTNGLPTMSQTIQTVAGQTYTLSFWMRLDANDNEFLLNVGGNTLAHFVDVTQFGYTAYNYQFTASATSTTLQFGFYNQPDYFYLDDISVQATGTVVPENQTASGLVSFTDGNVADAHTASFAALAGGAGYVGQFILAPLPKRTVAAPFPGTSVSTMTICSSWRPASRSSRPMS